MLLTKIISMSRKLPRLTIHEIPWQSHPKARDCHCWVKAPLQWAAPVTTVSPLAPHTPTPQSDQVFSPVQPRVSHGSDVSFHKATKHSNTETAQAAALKENPNQGTTGKFSFFSVSIHLMPLLSPVFSLLIQRTTNSWLLQSPSQFICLSGPGVLCYLKGWQLTAPCVWLPP